MKIERLVFNEGIYNIRVILDSEGRLFYKYLTHWIKNKEVSFPVRHRMEERCKWCDNNLAKVRYDMLVNYNNAIKLLSCGIMLHKEISSIIKEMGHCNIQIKSEGSGLKRRYSCRSGQKFDIYKEIYNLEELVLGECKKKKSTISKYKFISRMS